MFSQLPPRNNTSFSRAVATAAAALRALPSETALQYHQRIPVQYMVEAGRRGLYLYHHMGSGKSRTGVAAAEALAAALPDWHLLFVSTKSLHSNFAEEARKFYEAEGVPESEWPARLAKYKFVSSNASNMLVQLRRTQSTVIDLERTIVIIDEVHEMCNAIANGSANAHGFYTAIMRTRNLKLLCLSGTPITGDPFEFALAMNMVAGRDDHGRALFGESYAAFVEAFIEQPDAIDPDAGLAKKLPPADNTDGKSDDKPAKPGDKPDKPAKSGDKSAKPAKGGADKPADEEEARLSDLRSKSESVPTTVAAAQASKGLGMRNRHKFIARIIGLVSCYNPRDDVASGARDMFPEQLPQIVQRVPMSSWQYSAYAIARESELEEARRRIFSRAPVNPMARSAGGAQSTYRVATRQISNFAFPAHAVTLERTAGRLHFERHLEKLTVADLTTGLEMYSPKICMMIATMLRYLPESAGTPTPAMRAIAEVGRKLQAAEGVALPDNPPTGLGIIYSQFTESCIGIIVRVLEACGCEQVRGVAPPKVERVRIAEEVDPDDETIHEGDTDSGAKPAAVTGGSGDAIRFGVITGETEIWERDALRAAFRSRDNVAGAGGTVSKVGERGRVMALLLFTVVGATGTNTEGVTHVHKMESYWKPSRDEQVDTRAVRYKSHMMLPPALRRVQTFLYLSDYPAALRKKWHEAKMAPPEPTTDWQLYLKSSNLARVNAVFLLAINAASIDCTLWSAAMLARHGMSCHMCAPTDELLFLEDFRDDIADTTVRCRAPATSDVKAKLLELDGVKYAAYMEGTELRIVVWDAALGGYVPVARAAAAWDSLEAKARKAVKRS